MSEHQSKLDPGQIQFHQWCEPPLEPADYKISVTQTVNELAAGDESSKEFKHDFSFSVAGPRFTLDPLEIYSVYPPKGEIGDFANSLPHVVFTRRTLPWERSLDPAAGRKKGDTRPWMALLVFSASDFDDDAFPEVTSRKAGELLTPSDGQDARGPDFPENGLTGYESTDDLCSTIDLPWEKFQQAAPSEQDLGYLAHVREVNTGDKETLSFLADGWFSVVLANRFPEPRQPFSAEDFTDVSGLVKILKEQKSPLAKYLRGRFDLASQEALAQDGANHRSVLLKEFNRIVRGPSIQRKDRFDGVQLSDLSRKLLEEEAPQGSDVVRLNRLLLEDAYPEAIAKRPDFGGDASAAGDEPLAVENRAYLVSLEGVTGYLPGENGGNKGTAKKNIRLAVLASWGFHCEEAFSFKASMEKLDVKRLCVPWDKPRPSPIHTDAERQVFDAFERGYTALNHSTRLGEKAVSWYRGPLVPLNLKKKDSYTFRPAPDAAVRYNPLDGMMDVTYAAAYQLGRLLALQDRHFAKALYAYRSGVNRRINNVMREQALRDELHSEEVGTESDIMAKFLMVRGSGPDGPERQAGTPVRELVPGDDPAFSEDGELTLHAKLNLTIPRTITKWLGRRILLYRVPFRYLVPDEAMLPPDSMRFFYLDPGWLNCLLAGACSVGRSSAREQRIDEYLRGKFLGFALEESSKVRTRKPQESDDADDTVKISLDPVVPHWPLTGFLLRSPVVEGWQGLEMRAWKESDERDKNLLDPLRIDRLAPDIMLCIFNGKVKRIEIKQPPEGMHFGAAPDNQGFTRFHLRRLNESGLFGPGDQLGDESKTEIPLRTGGARVIEVKELANKLEDNLKKLKAMEGNSFTSAEFGVQMVESPGRVVFDVNIKQAGQP